jgi:hypothetical protein
MPPLRSHLTLRVAGFCAALTLVPAGAGAHTYLGFDWTQVNGNDRTTLLYSVDPLNAAGGLPAGQTWLTIADAMAGIWNAAGIGYTLRPTNQGQPNEGALTADTNIRIMFRDHNAPGGAFLDGIFDPNNAATMCDAASWPPRARVSQVLLCFDPTPISNQAPFGATTWRNDGAATLDPLAVMLHEVSHAMRLDHPSRSPNAPAGPHRTNPILPGDHGTALTNFDVAEGRGSAVNRGVRLAQGNIGAAGGAVVVQFPIIDDTAAPIAAPLSFEVPANVAAGNVGVTLRPLSGAALPFPVHGGSSPVFMAMQVGVDGALGPGTARVTFSYVDDLFTDDEFFPLHGPVDESRLGLFLFSGDTVNFLSGSWSLLKGTAFSRDTVNNTVSFDVPTSVFASDSVYLGIAVVPEPSTVLLLGAGLAGIRGWRLRGRAAANARDGTAR